jgi:hypothetical protein
MRSGWSGARFRKRVRGTVDPIIRHYQRAAPSRLRVDRHADRIVKNVSPHAM